MSAPAAPAARAARSTPYKGPDSFQVEDAALFFGRDAEARRLVARILSRRLTLLHAPSGAGKTSLLNARVIPDLERRGWMPVRVLPTDDPLASIRATTLQYLLPLLAAERRALRAAAETLAPGADPTLGELLAAYDALPVRDPRKRELIAPLEVGEGEASLLFPPGSRAVPYVCRLLRSSLSVRALAEHFAALPSAGAAERLTVTGDTRVSALAAMLAEPATAEAYDALFGMLNLAVATLADFFENLAEVYAPRPGFCLVLILDQFEELFTRFGDRPGMPSFRRREQTFRELEALYAAFADEERAPGAAALLPLRFVVSLRDEYLARVLDHVRVFAGVTGEPGYHLYLLDRDEAGEAVRRPASEYGYGYDDAAYEAIVDGLLREGRYVEPTALQIVCERLWQEQGRALVWEARGTPAAAPPSIARAALDELAGVKGILASFFTDFVERELQDPRARFEAFEMLELLVTVGRTRNIVEREQLVRQPFRDVRLRRDVLDRLEEGRIVRVEQRLDGWFVEITHEFLIDPVLARIKRELTGDTRYRDALRSLLHFAEVNFRAGTQVLSAEHFRALDEYFAAAEADGEIFLPPWTTELMFRSAIVRDVERATVGRWAGRLAELPDLEVPAILDGLEDGARRRWLSLEELRLLGASPGALAGIPAGHAEHILVSALHDADDAERADVQFWTRTYLGALAAP